MAAISIVIPIFNEASHVEESLTSIIRHVEKAEPDFEMIVVDDGSSDSSWDKIRELKRIEPQIRGLRLSRNFGKEHALAAGISFACGHAVIVMDADLQHPPELIREMIRVWKAGEADIVEGIKETSLPTKNLRQLLSRAYYFLYSLFTGVNLASATDFKLLDRKVVDAWASLPERGMFFRGLISWLGFRKAQIRFNPPPRNSGDSKFTYRKLFHLSLESLLSFSSLPLYLIPAAGFTFLLFALVLGSLSLAQWMAGVAVEGFTTVIILQLFIGGMVLCSLGIIGIYLSKLYEEVKGRPRYIISERIENLVCNEK